MVADIAGKQGLQSRSWPENWIPATRNDHQAVDQLTTAAQKTGLPMIELDQAQRWSDDFGVLTQHYRGAFFGLGGGSECGRLHGPDFDFPDALLSSALRLYASLVACINGL
jgi:metal-dependent amidase/aminoacylase/carboxypeptidase family protein